MSSSTNGEPRPHRTGRRAGPRLRAARRQLRDPVTTWVVRDGGDMYAGLFADDPDAVADQLDRASRN
jgi:hypothetical protein